MEDKVSQVPDVLRPLSSKIQGKKFDTAKRLIVAQVGSVDRGEKFDDDVADAVFIRLQRVAQVGTYTDESELAYRHAKRLDGEDVITVYRSAPKGSLLRPGDFASKNKHEAGFYTHGGNVIMPFKVKTCDLISVEGSKHQKGRA